MSGSPSSSGSRDINARTWVPTSLQEYERDAALRATSPDRAYALALAAHRARAGRSATVYWMTADDTGSRALEDDEHVIVGRHTECDLVLRRDAATSLRHLLVCSVTLDDGAPVLSILDLRTDLGFALSDDTHARAIQTTGPVALRLGATRVVAIPRGDWPDSLPAPVCERQGELSPVRAMRAPDPKSISRITMSSGVRHVSEDPASVGADWELELSSERGRAAVWLSHADLRHGVLVGRADRCVDEGLRRTLGMDISRVHALLIAERERVVLFDVASTQGTYVGGKRVRRVSLDADAEVTLASKGAVKLRWRKPR